jgi:hypothetical protein
VTRLAPTTVPACPDGKLAAVYKLAK